MFFTPLDLLYLVLSFAVFILTVGLSVLIYHLVRVLKDVNEITTEVKKRTLELSALAGEAGEKIFDAYQTFQVWSGKASEWFHEFIKNSFFDWLKNRSSRSSTKMSPTVEGDDSDFSSDRPRRRYK